MINDMDTCMGAVIVMGMLPCCIQLEPKELLFLNSGRTRQQPRVARYEKFLDCFEKSYSCMHGKKLSVEKEGEL